jgi:hypothetical protein
VVEELDTGEIVMAMRRVLSAAALLALMIAPEAALASASGKVYVTNCTHADFKPSLIILACGDAGAYVQKLNWSKWNSTSASGSGTYTYKTCKPNCAAGGTKSVAANVALSKPKSCPKAKKGKVFTEIRVTFPSHTRKSFSENLGCPY